MKVGVLGGGFAGIQVGHFLDSKHEVTILESQDRPGGLCRSFQFMGFDYDIGPHIFFSKNKEVLKYVLDIASDILKKHQRSNQIWYDGRLVKYPFENYLGLLPENERRSCLENFLTNPYRNYNPDNMLQFFLNRFGSGITDIYLRPYNEKIWKYDPAYLDLQMVGRIPHPPEQDVIDGANGNFKEGYTHQFHFYYPENGGAEALVNRFVERLPSNVNLKTGHAVQMVTLNSDGKFTVSVEDGSEFTFDQIINCMPLHDLIPKLNFDVPKEVLSSLNEMKYNSLYYGLAVFSKDMAGDNFSFNFPQKELLFHRMSKVNFLGNNSKQKNSAFLYEVTFRDETTLSQLDEKEFQSQLVSSIEKTGLAKAKNLVGFERRKIKYAYVIYDLKHRKNTDYVLKFLKENKINCTGRFAEFEYVNTDHVIERAQKLCQMLNKEWYVATCKKI